MTVAAQTEAAPTYIDSDTFFKQPDGIECVDEYDPIVDITVVDPDDDEPTEPVSDDKEDKTTKEVDDKTDKTDKPDEPTESKEDKSEKPRSRKVKVDGKEVEVTEDEAFKNYELRSAAYNKLQEASKLHKEASAYKAQADSVKAELRNIINDASQLEDLLVANAPATLQKLVDKKVNEMIQDHKLYQADPTLYESTVAQRDAQRQLRAEQQRLASEKAQLEAQRKQAQDQESQANKDKYRQMLDTTIPDVLVELGLPKESYGPRWHRALCDIANERWINGHTSLTRDYLLECARELKSDPIYGPYMKPLKAAKPVEDDIEAKEEKETKTDDKQAKSDKPKNAKKPTIIEPSRTSRPQTTREFGEAYHDFWR